MTYQSTLILGGARSGKSDFGQRLAEAAGGDVLFVATAQAFDEDMRNRIARHQDDRPPEWGTVEAPERVADAIASLSINPDVIVIDCITLLVSNILLRFFHPDESLDVNGAESALNAELDALFALIERGDAQYIIISNEVGLGIVPGNRLSRVYRDLLGRANQRLAHAAHEVILLVAGIPMTVKSSG